MTRNLDKYEDYADHPRYGKSPRFTGANPKTSYSGVNSVTLHWNTLSGKIADTAIVADPDRQIDALYPITHYFDLNRKCDDCRQMFIFFADEQKHWFEELQFSINATCVRCVECRKEQQVTANRRRQYETLINAQNRNDKDTLTLVDCCLTLFESSTFGKRSLETARNLLKSIPDDSPVIKHATYRNLVERSAKLLANA